MTISIGLLYDQLRPEERMIIEVAKKNSVELNLYNAEELTVELTTNNGYNFDSVILQRSISYFRGLHLAAALESSGIHMINSFQAAYTCGNKLFGTLALQKAKIPTPRAVVAFTPDSAIEALKKLKCPAVLKPVVGSWGRLVAPLLDEDSARAIFEDREVMFPLYQVYYIQEMINKPHRDIRCFVIGEKAVAAMYRYPPVGDWRTNASREGTVEACPLTGELKEISESAARAMGDGIFGVDLMEGPDGLLVHEVNSTPEFKSLVNVTNVDIASLTLDYAMGLAKK